MQPVVQHIKPLTQEHLEGARGLGTKYSEWEGLPRHAKSTVSRLARRCLTEMSQASNRPEEGIRILREFREPTEQARSHRDSPLGTQATEGPSRRTHVFKRIQNPLPWEKGLWFRGARDMHLPREAQDERRSSSSLSNGAGTSSRSKSGNRLARGCRMRKVLLAVNGSSEGNKYFFIIQFLAGVVMIRGCPHGYLQNKSRKRVTSLAHKWAVPMAYTPNETENVPSTLLR